MELAPALLERGVKVVDLSGAFRLSDPAAYPEHYGFEHRAAGLLACAVYGLPELVDRDAIASARLVANPGCYPTAAALALVPLLRAGLLTDESIVVDAASGVSGAGRQASETYSFCEVADDVRPYKVLRHQHTPEIAQSLSRGAGKPVRLTFTPHLLPIKRGILSTASVRLAPGIGGGAPAEALRAAYRDEGFPATIVRPSHTYDKTNIPLHGGWTALARMRQGEPVVVHGDGTSLWTLTHHDDFAQGFVPLLGHSRTLGESFHITSDDVLTWDQITHVLAAAAGVTVDIVHVPSEVIAAADPVWGATLLGDKAHSMVFDNSKLRSVVPGYRAVIPFEQGAREIVAWYDEDPARQRIDAGVDAVTGKLAQAFRPGA